MRRWVWRYKLLATLFGTAFVCIVINVLLVVNISQSTPRTHRLTRYDVATHQPYILVRMLQQQQQDAEFTLPVTSQRSVFLHSDEVEDAERNMVSEVETGIIRRPEQVIQAPVIRGNVTGNNYADVDTDDRGKDDLLLLFLEKLYGNHKRSEQEVEWEDRQSGFIVDKFDVSSDNTDDNKWRTLRHANNETALGNQPDSSNVYMNADYAERRQSAEPEPAQAHEQRARSLSDDSDFDEDWNRKNATDDVIKHDVNATTISGETNGLINTLDIAELTRRFALLQQNIKALSRQQQQHADEFRYHPRNIYDGRQNAHADDEDDEHQIDSAYDSEKQTGDQQIRTNNGLESLDAAYRHWHANREEDAGDTAGDDAREVVRQAMRRLDGSKHSDAASEARRDDNLQARQHEDQREMRDRDDNSDDIHQPVTKLNKPHADKFHNQRETDEEEKHSLRRRRNHSPYVYESFIAINSSKELDDIDNRHTAINSTVHSTEESIKDYEVRQGSFDSDGPGEEGHPVEDQDASSVEDGWKTAMFNQVVSDKISLERSVPDVRHAGCREKTYTYSRLSRTSVVICFIDESWSTLLRTVHSVINRTPPQLLQEILLVDDFSQLQHLHTQLDDYIAVNFAADKVRLVRLQSRQGLIRARLHGAHLARAPVVTFLDSHVECNRGWLEPLLTTIADNPQTVAAPVVDIIQPDTFAYVPVRDDIRGGLDWKLTFQWLELPDHILTQRMLGDTTELIDTPTISGGMFAVDAAFFKHLGMYDPQLEIWGAENLELSFKTWMCGGRLVIVPCSRVGHVYRDALPYSFPVPGGMFANVLRNSARVAEVWMDEYKLLLYRHFPWLHDERKASVGNLTERQQLRRRLRCHSFTWYLDNVFPELYRPNLYPVAHGQLRNLAAGVCMTVTDNGLVCTPCTDDTAQYVQLTTEGRLETLDKCVGTTGENVDAVDCRWEALTVRVRHRGPGDVLQVTAAGYTDALSQCITASRNDGDDVVLVVRPCQPQQRADQRWTFTYYSQH